ncbi:MAG: hypothetical protein AAF494_01380 [Pseudomonadota bacterium]
MRLTKLWKIAFAAAFSMSAAHLAAQPAYILELKYEAENEGLDETGNSSSSRGRQQLGERVLARTAQGTEIEYFIPQNPDEIRGNAMWKEARMWSLSVPIS